MRRITFGILDAGISMNMIAKRYKYKSCLRLVLSLSESDRGRVEHERCVEAMSGGLVEALREADAWERRVGAISDGWR